MIPNTWLIAGYRSPSYHAVGLMAPGLPFIAVGRNPDVAWGGTNMRAASSDLFAQSDLGAEAFVTRAERIKVRWWFDRNVTVRETGLGPILSDAPVIDGREGEVFALRWVGHEVTDEITAFLKANRARNWQDFRDAFAGYGVPAQNMIYADSRGHIGQLMAVKLPIRDSRLPGDLVLDPGRDQWRGYLGTGDLPVSFDPADGVIASANNRPVAALEVPVGYFFSSSDRVRRLKELVRAHQKLGFEDLAGIQRDVYAASAVGLQERLVATAESAGLGQNDGERGLIEALATWDGHYSSESRGALAFEVLVRHFIDAFYSPRMSEEDIAALAGSGRVFEFVAEDLDGDGPDGNVAEALSIALREAAPKFADFADWGEMHRLDLGHPLANIPVIGSRFSFADLAAAGSRETLMKTAHSTTDGRHATRYGSNSRHISDLSDPDENYFVLLGGQDGWFGSSTLMDQVPLWREGRYIRVPLRIEAVREAFPRRIVLQPEPPG
jgi:penicillin amidase